MTPAEERPGGTAEPVAEDYARMYYEHQYARMAKLEDHRLAVTNVVLVLTVATFAFTFSDRPPLNASTGLVVPATLLGANAFAIAYLRRTSQHILVHQQRAKEVLRVYAATLFATDRSFPMPRGCLSWLRTERMQLILHIALAAVSLLPVFLYLRQ